MAEDLNLIKKLREETGAGVMDAKRALAEVNGDYEAAKKVIAEKGLAQAEKRSERETRSGTIHAYIHNASSVGVLLELNCETSFVASTEEFEKLAHEIALQIASMEPITVEEVLAQGYIRDPKTTIADLIKTLIAKTGENITLRRFVRYQLED